MRALSVQVRSDGRPSAAPSQQPSHPPPAAPITRSKLLKSGLLLGVAAPLSAALPAVAAPVATPAAAAPVAAPAAAAPPALPATVSQVVLRTLSDCQLAVSVYPTFGYNAAGGGGSGRVARDDATGLLRVSFDVDTLKIPPISTATSTVLGVPIPPPLNIAIVPQRLEGTVDPESGEANLEFLARFEFTAGPLYTAPPLVVATTLTTERSEGPLRSGSGRRLGADGRARLVGVARVPKTGDGFLDGFLMLPTDALAVLSAELKFS